MSLCYTFEQSSLAQDRVDGCKFSAVTVRRRHTGQLHYGHGPYHTEYHEIKGQDAGKKRKGVPSSVSQGWTARASTVEEV